MAKTKEIRKRIRSVTNTRKITRTMEMVATSKLKRAQDRVVASRPYLGKLTEMLADLTGTATAEIMSRFPLLEQRDPVRRVLIFTLTANRGLCGALNSNVIRRTRKVYDEQIAQGREVELHAAGKKAVGFFRFQGVPMDATYTNLTDRPTFADADALAKIFVPAFLEGRVDKVILIYAHFQSALTQPPHVLDLLPIAPTMDETFADPHRAKDAEAEAAADAEKHDWFKHFIFSPSPEAILGALFPMYVRNMVYRVLAESVASEQSARRMAMKSATDNASDVITTLTRKLNRARQAQITQELSEIVGTAAALE